MPKCIYCNIKYGTAMYSDFKFCPRCGFILKKEGICIKCSNKAIWMDMNGLCLRCKINKLFEKEKKMIRNSKIIDYLSNLLFIVGIVFWLLYDYIKDKINAKFRGKIINYNKVNEMFEDDESFKGGKMI